MIKNVSLSNHVIAAASPIVKTSSAMMCGFGPKKIRRQTLLTKRARKITMRSCTTPRLTPGVNIDLTTPSSPSSLKLETSNMMNSTIYGV